MEELKLVDDLYSLLPRLEVNIVIASNTDATCVSGDDKNHDDVPMINFQS